MYAVTRTAASMISEKKLANAVGGRTARACDGCIRNRARWFCTADDAFLCQSCDVSVHSANSLARRHERVRLKTASFKVSATDMPSWHHGFTRKARTPRHGKHYKKPKSDEITQNPLHHVPEIGREEALHEDNYDFNRVPMYDHDAAPSIDLNEAADDVELGNRGQDLKTDLRHGCFTSEIDLEEYFTADVESLLLLDEESSLDILEEPELVDCKGKTNSVEESLPSTTDQRMVVIDKGAGSQVEIDDISSINQFMKLDYEVVMNKNKADEVIGRKKHEVGIKNKISLRLNYEEVMTAWADERSPWTAGERPELDPNIDYRRPDCMGSCGEGVVIFEINGDRDEEMIKAVGREAKVSRYREKRRKRLFSKKIRYEVRKLNAEKRPRIKGRFIKMTTTTL